MSADNEPAARIIENYVRNHFGIPSDDPYFNTGINLWEEGYVDSTGVVELIAFLESEFGVSIPERHLFSPDFTRIDGIARIIDDLRRQDGGDSGASEAS